MKGALKRPAFWFWLALAAWPPELIVRVLGWEIVDPGYLGVMIAWWPVDVLGRLGALALLLDIQGGPMGRPYPARRALASALAAEVLVGIKVAGIALVGLIPALAFASYLGADGGAKTWVPLLILAGLGLLPAAFYAFDRLLAPLHILRHGLRAHAALDASALQTRGRRGLFLRLLLPWLAASWALDLATLALPDSLAMLLAPLSLAAGLLALRKADQGLA